jgi:hypothetical protein
VMVPDPLNVNWSLILTPMVLASDVVRL